MRVLGLMSGTSADGVDAVLAAFEGAPQRPRWRILESASLPYPDGLQREVVAISQATAVAAQTWLEVSEAITEQQAAAAKACDPHGRADLVGCHGQTVWHRPPGRDPGSPQRGASLQLLQAPLLATLLQRPVVFDFRAADLALGGQGAPLVPLADQALLGPTAGWRAVLNLGGIANLTLIPPAEGPQRNAPLRGWDCGPANSLIDLAVTRLSGGNQRCDRGGAWAAQGRVEEACIARWLQEPYFRQAPPKSTGREVFGQADLERRLDAMTSADPADVLATLTAFSAACVAQELQCCQALELLVAGGGSRNATLMEQLRRRCLGTIVRPLHELGIGDAQREALAFALLAWWHQLGHPGNAPSVTGAQRAAVLGVCARP